MKRRNISDHATNNSNANFSTEEDNNLLKRLKCFLPEIAAANEELQQKLHSSQSHGQESLRIDASLQKDDGTDEQEEEEEDDEVEEENTDRNEGNLNEKKTIQMTVTLGSLESNPIISLLGDADDDDDQDASYDGANSCSSGSDEETSKPLLTVRSTSTKRKDDTS